MWWNTVHENVSTVFSRIMFTKKAARLLAWGNSLFKQMPNTVWERFLPSSSAGCLLTKSEAHVGNLEVQMLLCIGWERRRVNWWAKSWVTSCRAYSNPTETREKCSSTKCGGFGTYWHVLHQLIWGQCRIWFANGGNLEVQNALVQSEDKLMRQFLGNKLQSLLKFDVEADKILVH